MNKFFWITINKNRFKAKKGETILEVAQRNDVFIPTLCYHPDLKNENNCQICLVKIKGEKDLKTACSTKVKPGMEIITENQEIKKIRKINLELIFTQHSEECHDCVWNYRCHLLDLAEKYKVNLKRFSNRKKDWPIYQFNSSLIYDSRKCIDCRNCVEVCQNQGVGFLELEGKGADIKVVPSKDKNKDCIYCGQCLMHCPAGSFEGVGEFEDVEKCLAQKSKIVIFQYAPSIRTSIGEEFGFSVGKEIPEKLVGGIKKLGVNKVFDVSLGADFTTVEEAKELMQRLEKKERLPLMTSCCPAWVKYVEFYYPEFIPYLTSVRSPHIILGGIIKNYWAKKEKVDPKDIFLVSIMPCIAKKYEITRPELEIRGIKPVDYVLTTRGLAQLFKKRGIDLKKVNPSQPDSPLGYSSGAGIIYGASGGVMESALRTVKANLDKKDLKKIEFKKVRGLKGVKRAQIKIRDKKIKIGVINGNGQAKEILEKLKKQPNLFDYLEIMACPGGCVGGGGQPIPINKKIIKKRSAGLYSIDKNKKVRMAHENPFLKKVYQDFFNNQKIIKEICHTTYFQKTKKEVKILPPGQY